jgi:hypothetical protein
MEFQPIWQKFNTIGNGITTHLRQWQLQQINNLLPLGILSTPNASINGVDVL